MNYTQIFNEYLTSEGVPFYLLSKSVLFPQDDSLEIYDYVYSDEDMPWTIMSYKLYNSMMHLPILSGSGVAVPSKL